MAEIKQTNRTLALDAINPEKPDFLTVIGDTSGMDSLPDEKIKEINDRLQVTSFDELLQKFAPTIYSFFDANTQSVHYSLEKPEQLPDYLITPIPINMHNDFFKMLCTLLDAKQSQGVKNVDFKFENILDLITPKKVMDDIKQVRKELQYTYGQYEALPEGDPKKLDLADKLNETFEIASANYNNILAMLPLAIQDSEARLLLGAGEQGERSEKISAGLLKMGDDGELKVLEAPKESSTSLVLSESSSNQGLITALEEDYEAINGEETSNYVKDLVVRSFCPLPSTAVREIDTAKEIANHNAYLEFFTQAKNDFIKCAKPLIEKLLGIREFFDQYGDIRSKGMKPVMLVLNCTPEVLAKSNNIIRLHTYLNSVNNKNDYDNTIWFAVFPDLSMNKDDGQPIRRERFKGNKQAASKDVNNTESLSILVDCLYKYGVKTFFSFETREESTFNRIAVDGVDYFVNRCEPLMNREFSAFAVPCLPNITVIPKDKSGVVTGRLMTENGETATLSQAQEDIRRLWIEGVYISAAYIAAGIVAACQCPEFLRDRFAKNVHPTYPGVRFDIEAGNNALVVGSTFAKEITGFTNSVKAEINNKNFGFILASENARVKGKSVDRLTVYKARSLQSSGATFEPIYRTQVEIYFDRVFRQATGDYKQENIREFFSSNPKSQMHQWSEGKQYVNSIIQLGDEITHAIDEDSGDCEVRFEFSGESRNLRVHSQRGTLKAAK
jgi:hypothetical protein